MGWPIDIQSVTVNVNNPSPIVVSTNDITVIRITFRSDMEKTGIDTTLFYQLTHLDIM